MTRKRQNPTGKSGASSNCKPVSNADTNYNKLSSGTEAQRQRLLKALRLTPLSTLQARQELAIPSPAQRVYDLRNKGYQIITEWVVDHDSTGTQHRVGQYTLIQEVT